MNTKAFVTSAILISSLAMLTTVPSQAQMIPQQSTTNSTETIGGTSAPAAAPAPPPAETRQSQPKPRFTFGPDLGLYLPTKNLVRDRFGDSWFSLGFGFGQYETPTMAGKLSGNINFLTNKHNSNTVFLVPIGVQYRKALSAGQATTPYLGGEVDYVASDIHSATDGVKWGYRSSAAGSLFGGLDFGKNAEIQVSYIGFTDVAGYNFSGTNLTAGFRF